MKAGFWLLAQSRTVARSAIRFCHGFIIVADESNDAVWEVFKRVRIYSLQDPGWLVPQFDSLGPRRLAAKSQRADAALQRKRSWLAHHAVAKSLLGREIRIRSPCVIPPRVQSQFHPGNATLG